jgi:hypothetical protein
MPPPTRDRLLLGIRDGGRPRLEQEGRPRRPKQLGRLRWNPPARAGEPRPSSGDSGWVRSRCRNLWVKPVASWCVPPCISPPPQRNRRAYRCEHSPPPITSRRPCNERAIIKGPRACRKRRSPARHVFSSHPTPGPPSLRRGPVARRHPCHAARHEATGIRRESVWDVRSRGCHGRTGERRS